MSMLTRFSYQILPQLGRNEPKPQASAQRGRLVRIDAEGRPFVDFNGNPAEPVAAKLALGETEIAEIIRAGEGTEILLVFEDNDLSQPIIIGKLRHRLPSNGIEIYIRGRRFTVDADEEIELRCGEAKLRITREGKIIVLGNDVLSRARRRNRIKGGTVNIN
jgi:hypothetical protein